MQLLKNNNNLIKVDNSFEYIPSNFRVVIDTETIDHLPHIQINKCGLIESIGDKNNGIEYIKQYFRSKRIFRETDFDRFVSIFANIL